MQHQWESDPLSAAAEVVQDSADRMESIYRLLLHEQTLVQGGHTDRQLLSSIDCHKLDLATALETTKWQLEDFEREINASAASDKFQLKQNEMRRHVQFIVAVREQIIRVEQSMKASVGNSLRDRNMNEQDRDALALFLLGKDPVEHMANQESMDSSISRKFLDPAVSSDSKGDIDEKKADEIISVPMNGITYLDHNSGLNNSQTEVDLGPSVSFEEANNGRCDEDGTWDLEANDAEGRSYLQTNKLRGCLGRMNVFGSLGNFQPLHKMRVRRSFMKRLKDGEEQRQSPLFRNIHPRVQGYMAHLRSSFGCSNFHLSCSLLPAQAIRSSSCIRDYREKCQRSIHRVQARYHPLPSILVLLLTLIILSILVS